MIFILLLTLLGLVVGQSPPVASCSNGIAQLIDECPQIDQLNQLAADLLSRSIVQEKDFPSGCCRVISDLNAGRCFCDEEIVSQFREVIDDEFLPSLLFQASQVEPAGCSIRIVASVDKDTCGPFGNQIFPQDLAEVEEECTDSNLISDVLSLSDDNQFLVEAIDLLGLESQLDVLPTVTLLAPTDKAFNEWAAAEGIEATELFADEDFLVRILARHIVANATIEPENIQDPERFKALQGSFLNAIVNDDALLIQGYPVQMPAIQACNGLIYKIDTVLWPDNKTASNADMQASTGQIIPSIALNTPSTISLIPPPSQPPPPPLPQTILPPLTLPPIAEPLIVQQDDITTTTTTTTSTELQIKEEFSLSPLVMTLPTIPAFDVQSQPMSVPEVEVEPIAVAAAEKFPSDEPVGEQFMFQQNAESESFTYGDVYTTNQFAESDAGQAAVASPSPEPPAAEQKVSSQQDLIVPVQERATAPVMEVQQDSPLSYDTTTATATSTSTVDEKPCTINVYQLTTQFLPLFSNYLEYAEQQGLKDILERSTDITVIIPINTAFSGISEQQLASTWNPLNHIVMEELSLQQLSDQSPMALQTLAGYVDVSVSPSGKVAFGDIAAGGAEVVQSDVVGCNGRLQVVGQLILNSEVSPIGTEALFSSPQTTPDDQQFVNQIQSITNIETSTPVTSDTSTALSPPLPPPPPTTPPPSPQSLPPPPPSPSSTALDPTAPVLPDIVSQITSSTNAVASVTAVGTIPAPTPTFTRPPSPAPSPMVTSVYTPEGIPTMALPAQAYPVMAPAMAPASQQALAQMSPPTTEAIVAPIQEETLASTLNPGSLYEYQSPVIAVNSPSVGFTQPFPAPIDDFQNRQNFQTPATNQQQGVGANTNPPQQQPPTTPAPDQSYYTPLNYGTAGVTYEQGQGMYTQVQSDSQQIVPQVISELQTRVSTGSAMSAAVSEVDSSYVQESSPAYYVQTQSIDNSITPYGIINDEEAQPPCACTPDGMSGGVNTTLIGCAVFVKGWPSFCYVVNPYGCFLSKPSQKYSGARWRNCTVVAEDVGDTKVTQLEVLQQVATSTNQQSPPAPSVGGYTAPVETASDASTGPCSCSPTGTSGGVQTGRPGCVEHVPGYSPFCYVLDPLNCFVSRASTRYPSAGWRYCAVPSKGDEEVPSEMQNVVRVTILPVYDPLTGTSRYGMFLTPKDKARKL